MLVIIGLLVGGLLVAQSMIEAAKVQATIREIQQYDAAITNFQSKYNSLPGDSPFFPVNFGGGEPYSTGNNDGAILITSLNPAIPPPPAHFYGGDSNVAGGFLGEIGSFWHHLSSTGLQQQYLPTPLLNNQCGGPAQHNTGKPGTYFPTAPIGNNTGILVSTATVAGGVFVNENVYTLTGFTDLCFQDGGAPNSLKPSEAIAMDAKMDDGKANTGNVRAIEGQVSTGAPSVQASTGAAGCLVDNIGYKYNLQSTTERPCSLNIKILSQTQW